MRTLSVFSACVTLLCVAVTAPVTRSMSPQTVTCNGGMPWNPEGTFPVPFNETLAASTLFTGATTPPNPDTVPAVNHADERRDHEEAVKRLQGEHKRLGDRINAMYLDKLDGRVDSTFFDKMSAQWREEQNRCLREIERHKAAEQSYMDEGV